MPKELNDSPAHATNSFPGDKVVSYDEGLLVGYRWFDTKNVEPLYPFGYGLSYTTFNIKNASSDKETYANNETIFLSVEIENTGTTDGKEVIQVYASKEDSEVDRPVKELAYYNVEKKAWVVEAGTYDFKIGNSSRNIMTNVTIVVK